MAKKRRKTKQLICVITGRKLILSNDYYQKKLEKADGDETKLSQSYICREAKDLIYRGYDVDKTRDLLGVDDDVVGDVEQQVIDDLLNDSRLQYRNIPKFSINNYTSTKTDPDVEEFLKKVLK